MSMLVIDSVSDEGGARLWHAVEAATRAADHVGLPADPLEELLPLLAGACEGECVELWLGLVDGFPVAAADIRMPLHDNLSAATIDVRVHPGHRRRGHGRRLFTHALDRVRAQGRHRIFGEVAEPLIDNPAGSASAGRAFASAAGGRPVLTEIRRMLDLSAVDAVDADALAALRADAAGRASGYTLVQWVDRAPSELLGDLAVLMGRMSTDAPMEDMEWEPEAWTADRYLAKEDSTIARGRRRCATAVRHDASGRVVGYSDIGVNARRPEVAYQWDTIVAPDHRGHRLGLLLKAANLELLRSTLPGARLVNTWNAETNKHMIAINDALGFRPIERWREWQLDLPRKPGNEG